uniref:Uncharacterized protein n=1 Tax=Cacopsylla melanoneura TaxID=428564 RepID=A0A8D8RQ69_9HEMI
MGHPSPTRVHSEPALGHPARLHSEPGPVHFGTHWRRRRGEHPHCFPGGRRHTDCQYGATCSTTGTCSGSTSDGTAGWACCNDRDNITHWRSESRRVNSSTS